MYSEVVFILTVMIGVEIFVGIVLNTFVLMIHFGLWLKHRTLQTLDLILTWLGLTRFLLLIMMALNDSSVLVFPWLHRLNGFLRLFTIAMAFSNFCSLWFGTLLCVFYCVKIANYSHRLFVRLKLNISRMVPGLLLVSAAVSFVSALPFGSYVRERDVTNSTNIYRQFVLNYLNDWIFYVAGASVPLIIFCTASFLLVRSLWSHLMHMKTTSVGFRHPRLGIHINAVKSMLWFLFLYLISFVGANVLLPSMQYENKICISLSLFCYNAYPSLHSIALISSHKALNQAFRRVLCWVGEK